MMKAAGKIFFLALVLGVFMVSIFGCSEGAGISDNVALGPSLSPTLTSLLVSGNTISKKDGGILKLSCQWTSAYPISSATAYLSFVQGLANPTTGPTGIISTASGTATATKNVSVPAAAIMGQTATTTATTTVSNTSTTSSTTTSSGGLTNSSTGTTTSSTTTSSTTTTGSTTGTSTSSSTGTSATGTTTSTKTTTNTGTQTSPTTTGATSQTGTGTSITTLTSSGTGTSTSTLTATSVSTGTATGNFFGTSVSNPMVIPTGIATVQKTGGWSVEIPFPASTLTNAPVGKQQMLLWMVLNDLKTNTLAFELEFTQ